MKSHYDWTRYWCTSKDEFRLDPDGFLYDPGELEESFLNPSARTFQQMDAYQCLVLLGEPGIGKSTALHQEYKRKSALLDPQKEMALYLNVRNCADMTTLDRKLFENPKFESWRRGNRSLYLFIDSLDEAASYIPTIYNYLVDEFQELETSRLYPRLASRTADFPEGALEALKAAWPSSEGAQNFACYNLLPLRKTDVTIAAGDNDIDPEAFLTAVENGDAGSFAARPITLNFLLNSFKSNQTLPNRRSIIYESGCSQLCEEFNSARLDSRNKGNLTPQQRFVIAGRIAALTLLCKRNAVWLGPSNSVDKTLSDILPAELAGYGETVQGQPPQVTQDTIREVVGTALFSSRGNNRMGWVHQTYSEFLAARYLANSGMSPDQVMSLLRHPESGALVPQLHALCSWLVGMNRDVLMQLVITEPQIILDGDLSDLDDETKSQLTSSLLSKLDNIEITEFRLWTRKRYGKLYFAGLADLLSGYVCEKNHSLNARWCALDIVAECGVWKLVPDIAAIALDPTENYHLRSHAAYIVDSSEVREAKASLRPLAFGEKGEDPNDELKGYALSAIWPEFLTTKELFALLTPPKNSSLFGGYASFLDFDLPKRLRAEDLPEALDWVVGRRGSHDFSGPMSRLIARIGELTLENLTDEYVLTHAANAMVQLAEHHQALFADRHGGPLPLSLALDTDKRRLLLRESVPILAAKKDMALRLTSSQPDIITTSDTPFMLEAIANESDSAVRTVWANLIFNVFHVSDGKFNVIIIEKCQSIAELKLIFSSQFEAVPLDSKKAERARATFERGKRPGPVKPLLDPPPRIRVEKLLDRIDGGEVAAWHQLVGDLSLQPDSRSYANECESDIRKLPGWKEEDQRERIIQAAKFYIQTYVPEPLQDMGKYFSHRGYKAFVLVACKEPEFLESVPTERLAMWAPHFVAFPLVSEEDGAFPHVELLKLAYDAAPNIVVDAIFAIIDNNAHAFIVRRLRWQWDEDLRKKLLEKCHDVSLSDRNFEDLLEPLLEMDDPAAIDFAKSLMEGRPYSEAMLSKIVATAYLLVKHEANACWEIVWSAIQEDEEFAKRLVGRIEEDTIFGRADGFCRRLSPPALADLYLWLVERFPYNVNTVERHELRDGILRYLENTGTTEHLLALERICSQRQDLEFLKYSLVKAKERTMEETWCPPKPDIILRMVRDANARFVESEKQLLQVIIQSLDRFQRRLHGTPPAITDLWDQVDKKTNRWRPRDENSLSDRIVRHFRDDLAGMAVVANREVQIRRGQETDIYVTAIKLDSSNNPCGELTVIIEVKGCWHNELFKAMRNQLVDRYLSSGGTGLYVVGWFKCPNWDVDDSRLKKARSCAQSDVNLRLTEQADKVSSEKVHVTSYILDCHLDC